MKITINIQKKHLIVLVASIALLSGIFAFAYGTSNPSYFGHSADEIGPGTMQGPIGINGDLFVNGSVRLGSPFSPPGSQVILEGGGGTVDGADKVFYADNDCTEGVVRTAIDENDQVMICGCVNNPTNNEGQGKGWYCFE